MTKDIKKIVVNKCYGGFSISHEAVMLYGKLKGLNIITRGDKCFNHYYLDEYDSDDENKNYFSEYDIPRDDPHLIQVVETLEEEADGWAADLEIVEIPEGVDWYIDEYDGYEHVAEAHRTW